MSKFRILWVDSAGMGRFDDVEAKTLEEAIWQVATLAGEHATYKDAYPWRGNDNGR